MCGFAGFVNNGFLNFDPKKKIDNLKNILKHRGPDADGEWLDIDKNIFFLHTRLAIQGPDNTGHQPIISGNNKNIMLFNGEIYNHLELRKKYSKYNIKWKGNSDTETLAELFSILDVHDLVNDLEGMFAISVFNRNDHSLHLIRDTFGQKPLFYGVNKNLFIFGSSISVFDQFENFEKKISNNSINLFLKYSYIPHPSSIYDNIYKVEPGTILKIELNDFLNKKKEFNKIEYKINKLSHLSNSSKDIINNQVFENTFEDVIKDTAISDVEVGTFLSGGIDSSLVSYFCSKSQKKKIKTFSVGFQEAGYDESLNAKKVSNFINSEHYNINITDNDLIDFYEKSHNVYDEPFADSSQIPCFKVSELASRHVKVVLTGDGADEIFLGYNRYIFLKLMKNIFSLPKYFRKGILKILNNYLTLFKKNNFMFPQIEDKIFKLKIILDNCNDIKEYYKFLITNQVSYQSALSENNEFYDKLNYEIDKIDSEKFENILTSFSKLDAKFFLPNDIFTKVDKASMFFGLETRAPFLDQRIINFANFLSFSNKINFFNGKIFLRKIVKKKLPSCIGMQKKMGFSIPLRKWLLDNRDYFLNVNINYDIFSNIDDRSKYQKLVKNFFNNYEKVDPKFIWNVLILNKWFTEKS